MDGDCIQFYQAPRRGNVLSDEVRIEILQIRKTHQLRDIGIIPDIPLFVRVAVPPFFCRGPEERHVEEICFGCIHPVDLCRVELSRDQVLFDCIRVDPVIDLREVPPDIPAEFPVLIFLESLEFFDEIELEFYRDP